MDSAALRPTEGCELVLSVLATCPESADRDQGTPDLTFHDLQEAES